MAKLIRETAGGLPVQLQLSSANTLGTLMKISAASQASQAGPGDTVVGVLISNPLEYPGNGTILTPYIQQRTVIAAAAISAGARIKIGTAGTGGVQRYAAFVAGTDDPILDRGLAVTAASGADASFEALIK